MVAMINRTTVVITVGPGLETHLTAFDTVDQSRVRVPLKTSRADDSLHPCGVQPVGDVPDSHVHWQDDGLTVVVQARGGAL